MTRGKEIEKGIKSKDIKEAALINGFGKHLAALRKEQNLSQAELAKRADLSRGYIAIIEQGRVQGMPSRKIIKALAGALHIKISDLLEAAGYELEEGDEAADENSPVENSDTTVDGTPQARAVLPHPEPLSHDAEHIDIGGHINNLTAEAEDVWATLKWAYDCVRSDPNFNYEQRMGSQDFPFGKWLSVIDVYQTLTGRTLLKPEEIVALRNMSAENSTPEGS